MIRGLKIYGLLLFIDFYVTFFVHPKRVVSLLIGLVMSPFLVPGLMAASREHQNRAIVHGLMKCPSDSWVHRRFWTLFNAKELAEIEAQRVHPASHEVICWECHYKHGCKGPGPGETLDHGCHYEGGCPADKLVRKS